MGELGSAFGNLIVDIIAGYSPEILFSGFIAQFSHDFNLKRTF